MLKTKQNKTKLPLNVNQNLHHGRLVLLFRNFKLKFLKAQSTDERPEYFGSG